MWIYINQLVLVQKTFCDLFAYTGRNQSNSQSGKLRLGNEATLGVVTQLES